MQALLCYHTSISRLACTSNTEMCFTIKTFLWFSAETLLLTVIRNDVTLTLRNLILELRRSVSVTDSSAFLGGPYRMTLECHSLEINCNSGFSVFTVESGFRDEMSNQFVFHVILTPS